MIKRRAFLFYSFIGFAMLYLVYNMSNTYSSDHYEISADEQRIQTPFQVPDPFPKGKPDFRKKKPEDADSSNENNGEEQQLAEQQEQQNEKELQDKAKEAEEQANTNPKNTEGEEGSNSEGESKEGAEKEATKEEPKKEPEEKKEEKKENKEEKKETKEGEKSEEDDKDDNSPPLYDKYLAKSNPDTEKLTLKERVADRHKRYLEYMKMHSQLSEKKQKKESSKLQGRFLGMEHEELKNFESPVAFLPEDFDEGTLHPASKNIVVLTASDGNGNSEIGGVLEAARENRKEYCAYHGYHELFVNLTRHVKPGWHPVWSKMGAIREAFETFPEAEWVWWLDTDAIIMNAEIDITKHILHKRALKERLTYSRPLRNPEANFYNGAYMEKGEVDFDNIDVVISQDFFGLNAGSFFIRRSAFTDFLLEMWEDKLFEKQEYIRREQDALIHIFLNHERFQQHFGLVPQRLLNSYFDDPQWVWSYKPGDFIVHLAGCNTKGKCESSFVDLWNKRTQVPSEHHVSNRIDLKKFFRNSDTEVKKEENN